MDTEGMIEVPADRLRDFVRGVYDRSRPQGMGHMHYRPGSLTDDEVDALIAANTVSGLRISLDYVKGRACKMVVFSIDGRWFIRPLWFDHTEADLRGLLRDVGVELPNEAIQKFVEGAR